MTFSIVFQGRSSAQTVSLLLVLEFPSCPNVPLNQLRLFLNYYPSYAKTSPCLQIQLCNRSSLKWLQLVTFPRI